MAWVQLQEEGVDPDVAAVEGLWAPQPGPQTMAYESEADELLYGGAAGGGKTDLMIGLGINHHHRSVIYRRQFTQTWDIWDRLEELLAAVASSNLQRHRWQLGASRYVEVGGVDKEADWKKKKGRPRDLICFDELSEFTQLQWRRLTIWNRSTVPGQRVRVVAGSNPPIPEPDAALDTGRWMVEEFAPWLRKDFPDPAGPGELRWFTYVGDVGEDDSIQWFRFEDLTPAAEVPQDERPTYWTDGTLWTRATWERVPEGQADHPWVMVRSRTFIPARVTDNKYLMATTYAARLDTLDPVLRAAFRDGEFNLETLVDPRQVIPTEWVELAMKAWEDLTPEDGWPVDGAGDRVPVSAVGVDPARGGPDWTVLAPRVPAPFGLWFGPVHAEPGETTPRGSHTAAIVMMKTREWGGDQSTPLVVDAIGVGASVVEPLEDAGMAVVAFNAGAGTDATDNSGHLFFVNQRALAWWRFRELLNPENQAPGKRVCLPRDRRLKKELTAPRFDLTPGKGILIEDKDALRKRLGHSTDYADALIQAALAEELGGFNIFLG